VGRPNSTDDWDRHWGDFAESAAANPAQRYRLRLIFSHLAFSDARARLVDIGSGQGDLLVEVRRRRPQTELLGIELSEAGCMIARRKVPEATLLQRDLLKPGDVPPAFRRWGSHAVCSEVLEHVDRPDRLLLNATAFLAPGCQLIVTVPGGPMSAFDRHIGHRRHYTRQTLRAVLEAGGLQVERVAAAGFPFHSLYRLAVLARGRNLASDVAGPSSRFRRGVMRAFDVTFRLNLPLSPWGWQLVAIARVSG
jgi:SAM-dependent methyltransferase